MAHWGVALLLLVVVVVVPHGATAFTYTIVGASTSYRSLASRGFSPLSFPGSNVVQQTMQFPFSFDPGKSGSDLDYSSGAQPTNNVAISFRGEVFLDIGSPANLGQRGGLCACTTSGCITRISVINCPTFVSGNVYISSSTNSFIVSFENMKITSGGSNISAQVELYSNGNFELRYGADASLGGNTCAIGAADQPVGTCFGLPFGGCSSDGLCTSFPGNYGWLFGK